MVMATGVGLPAVLALEGVGGILAGILLSVVVIHHAYIK